MGTERGVGAAVTDEDEDALVDTERRLALDTHGDIADVAAKRFDDHLLFVRRVASNLPLDSDAVPGPNLPVAALEGLGEQHASKDDSVGMADQFLELEPLDDRAIGGTCREAYEKQDGDDRAYQPGQQREFKHFPNLGAPTPSVKRSVAHDLN
ncbi:MAG: hypothetical protein JRG67_17215 [Deltaproteobacteria bacterium]|nr:hypothetical protein [Deltaproteobacteria bacterium]